MLQHYEIKMLNYTHSNQKPIIHAIKSTIRKRILNLGQGNVFKKK